MTSYFCIPVPYNEKDIFFGVLVLNSLVGLIEPFNFSFFSVTDWGIGLDYRVIEWFALETNEIASKYCILAGQLDHSRVSRFYNI